MVTGSGSVVYGAVRYFGTLKDLGRGGFRPSFWGAGGLAGAVLGLASVAVWDVVGEHVGREGEGG